MLSSGTQSGAGVEAVNRVEAVDGDGLADEMTPDAASRHIDHSERRCEDPVTCNYQTRASGRQAMLASALVGLDAADLA